MIPCAKCGYENPLGHIFCTRCRARLDLKKVTEEELVAVKEPGGRRWLRIMLAIDLLIVVAVGLSLWPAYPAAKRGTVLDLQQARRKVALMEKGVYVAPQVFSEKEVNACLASVFERKRQSKGAGSFQIRSVQVKLKPNAIILSVVGTWGPITIVAFKLGPLDITYGITAVPEVRNDGVHFTIIQGRVGHLPLPGPLGKFIVAWMERLFTALPQERSFFAKINCFDLEDGNVTISLKK